MKKVLLITFVILIHIILFTTNVKAQADTLMKVCSKHLAVPYISDGQQYRTFLNSDDVAEFKVTFYGNTTYRIVAGSGLIDGNLIFSLYDSERNILFTNKDYNNTPFWDFKFKSTTDCIIEAKLDPRGPKSGLAIVLIGFKQ